MRAKLSKLCSAAALLVGITTLGGAECIFNVDEDDGIFKAAVVQEQ